MLVITTQVTEVHVGLTQEELADVQIKEQEKQRVLGVIPNFYVSYDANPAPLTAKHKFELAWKSASDPVDACRELGSWRGLARPRDRWGGYGQGAQGYAKRYEQGRVRNSPALGEDAQADGCREQQEDELEAGH